MSNFTPSVRLARFIAKCAASTSMVFSANRLSHQAALNELATRVGFSDWGAWRRKLPKELPTDDEYSLGRELTRTTSDATYTWPLDHVGLPVLSDERRIGAKAFETKLWGDEEGDGAHRGFSIELYPEFEEPLKRALASTEAFDSRWISAAKDPLSLRVWRPYDGAPVQLEVSALADNLIDAADSAVWLATGRHYGGGSDALHNLLNLSDDEAHNWLEKMTEGAGLYSDIQTDADGDLIGSGSATLAEPSLEAFYSAAGKAQAQAERQTTDAFHLICGWATHRLQEAGVSLSDDQIRQALTAELDRAALYAIPDVPEAERDQVRARIEDIKRHVAQDPLTTENWDHRMNLKDPLEGESRTFIHELLQMVWDSVDTRIIHPAKDCL